MQSRVLIGVSNNPITSLDEVDEFFRVNSEEPSFGNEPVLAADESLTGKRAQTAGALVRLKSSFSNSLVATKDTLKLLLECAGFKVETVGLDLVYTLNDKITKYAIIVLDHPDENMFHWFTGAQINSMTFDIILDNLVKLNSVDWATLEHKTVADQNFSTYALANTITITEITDEKLVVNDAKFRLDATDLETVLEKVSFSIQNNLEATKGFSGLQNTRIKISGAQTIEPELSIQKFDKALYNSIDSKLKGYSKCVASLKLGLASDTIIEFPDIRIKQNQLSDLAGAGQMTVQADAYLDIATGTNLKITLKNEGV
jgi:hypothetical protein